MSVYISKNKNDLYTKIYDYIYTWFHKYYNCSH